MSNIQFNFKGKVALITGSGSGIGAATAILFAKSGANVVIIDRNATKLSDVAQKCQQISPNNLKPLQVLADVTKEEDLKRIVESTIEEFGKLDILVNNAGCAGMNPINDPDFMNVFKGVLQTNLYSAVYLTHLCAEHLVKTKGNIINISSVAAFFAADKNSSYSVSKCAINMFTKCMAGELGAKGIRVNSVSPGTIKTDILEGIGLDRIQADRIFNAYGQKYPVGRAGEAHEIAYSILYLASDESSFITGTIMVADGGHIAANVNIDTHELQAILSRI